MSEHPNPESVLDPERPLPGWDGAKTVSGLKDIPLLAEQQTQEPRECRVADALVGAFADMGIRRAYGVSGGAMATFWEALTLSDLSVLHFRHEGGAAFAAIEAHFASDEPVLLFTTAGPGITNALTGILAAKGEGAKIVMVSACTPAGQRGRFGTQETDFQTLPASGIFSSGPLFDCAEVIESADQLPQLVRRLKSGLEGPGGFTAHVSLTTRVQTEAAPREFASITRAPAPESDRGSAADVAARLAGKRFALWVGFGARHASREIVRFAERYGTPVFATPRGKGVFPESHLLYTGVTGLGGHTSVAETLSSYAPEFVLVLGTRLHESSSFWSGDYAPPGGFIHVDVDPTVPGQAYCDQPTVVVQAEIAAFLAVLTEELGDASPDDDWLPRKPIPANPGTSQPGRVRPEFLMEAIQSGVIDDTDAIVIAESGNSFIWSQHHLSFDQPRRYRASTQVGSMGHAVAGVVGAAHATGRKAVAITGDGSMLMNNEISTAVAHGIPAVWVILNDGHYNMCRQGMASLGLSPADTAIPPTDFVGIARAMGADGLRVGCEDDLKTAFDRALSSNRPFVLDVLVDVDAQAPSHGRNRRLAAQR